MDVADQPSSTWGIEHKASTDMIGGRIVPSNIAQMAPRCLASRAPRVIKPLDTMGMTPLRLLDRGPGDDVHGSSLALVPFQE
jgi:hypothetical protein